MEKRQGDVYSFYMENKRKYSAVQIIAMLEKNRALLIELDYYADTPITEEQLPALKPLWVTHHSWAGKHSLFAAQDEAPEPYKLVGNITPVIEKKDYILGDNSWFPVRHIDTQKEWDALPKTYTLRYKEAGDSPVTVGGIAHKESSSKVTALAMSQVTSSEELDQLPRLAEIYTNTPSDWLVDYLKTRPALQHLSWQNHGQEKLDFTGADINRIALSTSGLKTVRLDERTVDLQLLEATPTELKILTPQHKLDTLRITENLPSKQNLSVRSLLMNGVNEIDIEAIFDRYPDLETLQIWGNPTKVVNMAKLALFKNLSHFSIQSANGFTAEDFPSPEQLPSLKHLGLSDISKTVGVEIKKQFSKQPHLTLEFERLK